VGDVMPVVVIFKGAAKMVRAKLAEAERPAESFTVTLTVNVPGEVGVPLTFPFAATVRPAGNPLADQE
jgi:hypothetical protein